MGITVSYKDAIKNLENYAKEQPNKSTQIQEIIRQAGLLKANDSIPEGQLTTALTETYDVLIDATKQQEYEKLARSLPGYSHTTPKWILINGAAAIPTGFGLGELFLQRYALGFGLFVPGIIALGVGFTKLTSSIFCPPRDGLSQSMLDLSATLNQTKQTSNWCLGFFSTSTNAYTAPDEKTLDNQLQIV